MAFYHSDKDYELFLKFFEFLNGKTQFTYEEYLNSYDDFADYVEENEIDVPVFFETSNHFLQFLYQLNIISYIENTENSEPLIHWCFRERSYANLNPKIKAGVRYQLHYGLAKVFNIGQKLKIRKIQTRRKK